MADNNQGWYDDSEGHAQAAKGISHNADSDGKGWRGESERHAKAAQGESTSEGFLERVRSKSDRDASQDTEGQGWHGESERHAEAAEKGHEDS